MFLGFAAVFNAVRVSCIVVGPQVFAQLLRRCEEDGARTNLGGVEQRRKDIEKLAHRWLPLGRRTRCQQPDKLKFPSASLVAWPPGSPTSLLAEQAMWCKFRSSRTPEGPKCSGAPHLGFGGGLPSGKPVGHMCKQAETLFKKFRTLACDAPRGLLARKGPREFAG